MASPLALALLGGAIAGTGTAVVASIVMAPPAKQIGPLERSAEEDWRGEVSALRTQNEKLQRRLEDLEAQLSFAQSERSLPAEFVVNDEEALQEMVKQAVAGLQGEKPLETAPVYLPDVEAALKVVEQQREQERDQRREQQMTERLEERLGELTTKLALGPDQVSSLRTTVTGYYKKSADYFRMARESGDFANMRDTMRLFRDEADTAIKNALSPTQQQQYDEADISLLGFGRGDFGGDFGGGGGGRGGR